MTTAHTSSPLVARWKAVPRAVQWAIIAAALMILYFVAIEPALGKMATWSSRADTKESDLNKFDSNRRARADADNSARLGVTNFGKVNPPGDASTQSQEFNRKVLDTIEAAGIKRPTIASRTVPLSNTNPLVRAMGSDFTVQRLVNEITCDAEPEQIAKFLAALEQSPDVATISRLNIRQINAESDQNRLVRASLAVESWAFQKKAVTK